MTTFVSLRVKASQFLKSITAPIHARMARMQKMWWLTQLITYAARRRRVSELALIDKLAQALNVQQGQAVLAPVASRVDTSKWLSDTHLAQAVWRLSYCDHPRSEVAQSDLLVIVDSTPKTLHYAPTCVMARDLQEAFFPRGRSIFLSA